MRTRSSTKKDNGSVLKKLKKFNRKDRQQPKEHAETKKPRAPVQQNRFTNILELSTLSASLMQLHDLFGTLVLDFSQDPMQVKISDVTGNYELNVSKESLSEFKMKVLLGQNGKGKPAFTIFLGECQCYPEQPEGTLELKDNSNEDTGSQIDSIVDESRSEAKIDDAVGSEEVEKDAVRVNTPTVHIEDESQKHVDSDDMVAPFLALFEGNEKDEDDSRKESHEKIVVTYETHHVSINETQKLEPSTDSDELIVKMRPKWVATKLQKNRPAGKNPNTLSTAAQKTSKKASRKRSIYRSNLEGFVKFLMTDTVCGSLLDKTKTTGNFAQTAKRISEPTIVNYSDGQEYRAFFHKEEDVEKKEPVGSAHSNHPSNRRETRGHVNDAESTGGGTQVLIERPKPFEKYAFVEQVKKEIEEWRASGKQTINVEIVDDPKSSSSTEDSDSNVVTVYEDPKTSQKRDVEFEDASSNCWTESVVDSTEKVFIDLKENENPKITEENVVVTNRKSELDSLEWMDLEKPCKREETEKYVAPIPLETTSTADIEAMWMSFVEMFHQSSELSDKLSPPCQETVNPASLLESNVDCEVQIREDSNRDVADGTYPGQNSLPYFVEESLKRMSSMLGTWRSSNYQLPTVIKNPQDTACPPPMSNLSRFQSDFTSGNKFLFSPNDDVPTSSPFHQQPALPKCTKKKKKKRYERPRCRLPFIDEIRAQLSNHKMHANRPDDKVDTKNNSSPILRKGKSEDKSLFTDALSETGAGDDRKPGEESSSTLEDPFYDAPDLMEPAETDMLENFTSQINLHLKLEGEYLNVTVNDLNGMNFVKISRYDLESLGVDFTITTGNNGIPKKNFNLIAEPVEPLRRIDFGVQTAVVLGTEEISEPEEVSILTSKANKVMDPISEEEREPTTEAYMVSEMSEDCLQTFDSAHEMQYSEKGSLEDVKDLVEENQAKPKPLTDSTVSSIPMDTFTCERGPSDVSPSIMDSRVVLNTYSSGPPTAPVIKSKSDSLVVTRRIPKKKYDHVNRKDVVQPDVYSSMYNKSEYGEWEFSIEKTHNLGFCSSDWIDEKSYMQYEELTDDDLSRRFQEAQERPMTSAADAVKSMHQALKPINDQINDIRTKMIGMNIQPRESFRPSRSLVPDLPPQESSFSIHSRINRWLVTDPVEFSSSLTTSDGSALGCDYLDDIPVTTVPPNRRLGKLVIFPGDLRSSYTRNVNIDDLSLTRSSIVTEPEDIS